MSSTQMVFVLAGLVASGVVVWLLQRWIRSDAGRSNEPDDLAGDCRVMFRFAREESFDIPAALATDIATLDGMLGASDIRPIVQGTATVPRALTPPGSTSTVSPSENSPTKAGAAEPKSVPELLMEVHTALGRVVAPATPASLRLPPWPPIVKLAMSVAVTSAAVFLVTTVLDAAKALSGNAGPGPVIASASGGASALPGPVDAGTRRSSTI